MTTIKSLEIGTVVTDGNGTFAVVRESCEARSGKFYANSYLTKEEEDEAIEVSDIYEDQF